MFAPVEKIAIIRTDLWKKSDYCSKSDNLTFLRDRKAKQYFKQCQ